MRGDEAPAGDVRDRRVARWAGAVTFLLLVVASTAAPATAASTASSAVQAATARGTPVIPPPPPEPEPFTCTPSRTSIFCTRRAETCETIGGVRTCFVRRVTCLQIAGYKRCVLTTSTCRTVTSARTGRPRTTCRTGFGIAIPHIAGSLVSGSIPRFTAQATRGSGSRGATKLLSTTTAAAPPVANAVASPGPTVPPGTAIGALVLVVALVGLTITRRRPRSGG